MMKIIPTIATAMVMMTIAAPPAASTAPVLCDAGDSCDVVTHAEFDKVRISWTKSRTERVFDSSGYSYFEGSKYLTKQYFATDDGDYVTVSYVRSGARWALSIKTWHEAIDD